MTRNPLCYIGIRRQEHGAQPPRKVCLVELIVEWLNLRTVLA
jgi:hypothetical protein